MQISFDNNVKLSNKSSVRNGSTHSKTRNKFFNPSFTNVSDSVCFGKSQYPKLVLSNEQKGKLSEIFNELVGEGYEDLNKNLINMVSVASKRDSKKADEIIQAIINLDNDSLFYNILREDSEMDAILVLNNLKKIDNMLTERLSFSSNIYNEGFYDLFNEKNYSQLMVLGNNKKIKTDDLFANLVYHSKPHDIRYGNDTAKVDSIEIISLLTGDTLLSKDKPNKYEQFDDTVKTLLPAGVEYDSSMQYKIIEGILRQRPELRTFALLYKELSANGVFSVQDSKLKFFKVLNNTGLLPKIIELRTIYPDENALKVPYDTVKYYNSKPLLKQ